MIAGEPVEQARHFYRERASGKVAQTLLTKFGLANSCLVSLCVSDCALSMVSGGDPSRVV